MESSLKSWNDKWPYLIPISGDAVPAEVISLLHKIADEEYDMDRIIEAISAGHLMLWQIAPETWLLVEIQGKDMQHRILWVWTVLGKNLREAPENAKRIASIEKCISVRGEVDTDLFERMWTKAGSRKRSMVMEFDMKDWDGNEQKE